MLEAGKSKIKVPALLHSNESSLPSSCTQSLSCIQLFATPWTIGCQTPLSMGFSRQEYGVGCHFLLQGTFPSQGSNLCFLHWQVVSLPPSHVGSPGWGRSISLNITEVSPISWSSTQLHVTPLPPSSPAFSFLSYWPSRNGLSNNVALPTYDY